MLAQSDDIEFRHSIAKLQFLQEIEKLLSSNLYNYKWNHQLLKQAEVNCGFKAGYYFMLFGADLQNIISAFEKWQDQSMLSYLRNSELPNSVREKIAKALIYRLMGNIEQRQGYKIMTLKSSTYLAWPQNAKASAQIAWRTCDLIWQYAGDKSLDFNYYSKRSLLLSVYMPAKLFFISDQSYNFLDTEEFIKTSLINIINIAKLKYILK